MATATTMPIEARASKAPQCHTISSSNGNTTPTTKSNECRGPNFEQTSDSTQLFTLFPKFPLEIRLMVWEAALPGPRVIELVARKLKKTAAEWKAEVAERVERDRSRIKSQGADVKLDGGKLSIVDAATRFDQGKYDKFSMHCTGSLYGLRVKDSADNTPSLLFVSKEAFKVASRIYRRSFDTPGSFPQTYFCAELDTVIIYLGSARMMRLGSMLGCAPYETLSMALQDIQHLAFGVVRSCPALLRNFLASLLFRPNKIKTVTYGFYQNKIYQQPVFRLDTTSVERTLKSYEEFEPSCDELPEPFMGSIVMGLSRREDVFYDIANVRRWLIRDAAKRAAVPVTATIEGCSFVNLETKIKLDSERQRCEKELQEFRAKSEKEAEVNKAS